MFVKYVVDSLDEEGAAFGTRAPAGHELACAGLGPVGSDRRARSPWDTREQQWHERAETSANTHPLIACGCWHKPDREQLSLDWLQETVLPGPDGFECTAAAVQRC